MDHSPETRSKNPFRNFVRQIKTDLHPQFNPDRRAFVLGTLPTVAAGVLLLTGCKPTGPEDETAAATATMDKLKKIAETTDDGYVRLMFEIASDPNFFPIAGHDLSPETLTAVGNEYWHLLPQTDLLSGQNPDQLSPSDRERLFAPVLLNHFHNYLLPKMAASAYPTFPQVASLITDNLITLDAFSFSGRYPPDQELRINALAEATPDNHLNFNTDQVDALVRQPDGLLAADLAHEAFHASWRSIMIAVATKAYDSQLPSDFIPVLDSGQTRTLSEAYAWWKTTTIYRELAQINTSLLSDKPYLQQAVEIQQAILNDTSLKPRERNQFDRRWAEFTNSIYLPGL
jgi:hypothetical protein